MQSRRDFLKIVGTTTGGVLFLPKFLSALPNGMYENYASDRQILVVVQLNGGNDGLNTFIPYDSPQYYDFRKSVAIPKDNILKTSGGMGFHPSMQGFSDMMQQGNLSVIQNVGYPNPNRSHFRSIEIWQTGSAPNEYLTNGWLGRYLDANCVTDDPLGGMNLDSIDALSLRGATNHSLTMQDPVRFERQLMGLHEGTDEAFDTNPNLDFVRKLMTNSFEGSDQIKKALEKTKADKETYPKHGLANNLHWIARMIKGDLTTGVYYTSLGGFDTHAGQLQKQKSLLNELSESVKAFHDDMLGAGLLKNVTLMVFSEFGRRVHDNGSGTDHGTAAPVFIMGGGVKGGIIGRNPDLDHLDNGDLKHEYDFRSVYAAILKQKLKVDPLKAGIHVGALNGLF